ncbi:MAG TPA: dihydrofolate reductase family protein [Pyrinomonadaceae bacterium]|nr:dihydrofolate reductase family protein [Pyrinomonadaceae bacterium]
MSRRKIIVHLATSADGFIARKDGAVDWLDRPSPKGDYGMGKFFQSIDTIIMGRKTYDVAVRFVKEGKPIPSMGGIKQYVFSRKAAPRKALPGFEFINEPIKSFARRLRGQKGKDIWMMGGAGIIGSFLDAGAIDEFSIHVIPTLIGEGIPLIAPQRRTTELKLISTKNFPDGVVRLHYAIAEQGQSPSARSRK